MTRQNWITYLLVSLFPFETWAIFQVFNDADWILRRSNLSDYLAFSSYSLLVALFEGLVIALLAWMLGILTSQRIKREQMVNLLGVIIWLTAFWAAIGQLVSSPGMDWTAVLLSLDHPLRLAYVLTAVFIIFIVGSVAVPVFLIWRASLPLKGLSGFFERISTLSWLYLGLNAAGLVYIIIRNLPF